MFENLKAGWEMGSATRKLVFKDKSLLLYPILAVLIGIVEIVAIFGSMLVSLSLASSGASEIPSALLVVGLFVYYLLVSFTSTYVLMAMFIAFRSFARGKKMGLGEALAQTRPYAMVVLEWSVFSAVVLLIIRIIEGRLGGIGRALFGLAASVGMAMATFFAIPVLLDKKTGPVETVKESTAFLVDHFGNTFGGMAYAELYSIALALAGVAFVIIGLALALSGSAALFDAGALVAVAGVVLVVFAVLLGYVLSNVFKLIVYEYVNSGSLPKEFSEDMVKKAIMKGGGRGTPPERGRQNEVL
jgi:hypothetical protein